MIYRIYKFLTILTLHFQLLTSNHELMEYGILPAGFLTRLCIRGCGGSYDVVLGERTETLAEVLAGLSPAKGNGGHDEYKKLEGSHSGNSEA